MSKAEADNILDIKDALPEVTPTPDPQQKPVSSAQALKERLDWGEPGLTIIDVREREKFNTERIMGAIAMPLEELSSMAQGKFANIREIYVYGENQEQSEQAASQLRQMGYNSVSQIQGGLSGWKAVSGPTEGRIG
jgi:rhodanese-related sulfurtransferase